MTLGWAFMSYAAKYTRYQVTGAAYPTSLRIGICQADGTADAARFDHRLRRAGNLRIAAAASRPGPLPFCILPRFTNRATTTQDMSQAPLVQPPPSAVTISTRSP